MKPKPLPGPTARHDLAPATQHTSRPPCSSYAGLLSAPHRQLSPGGTFAPRAPPPVSPRLALLIFGSQLRSLLLEAPPQNALASGTQAPTPPQSPSLGCSTFSSVSPSAGSCVTRAVSEWSPLCPQGRARNRCSIDMLSAEVNEPPVSTVQKALTTSGAPGAF